MRTVKCTLFVIALSLANPLAAQTRPDQLQPGDRIRLTVPAQNNGRFVPGTGRWVVGRLISLDSGRVAMKVEGQGEESEYTVPFTAIQDFQVSRGGITTGQGRARGMTLGAATGAGLAGVLMGFGYLISGPVEDGEICDSECELVGWSAERGLRNGAIGAIGGGLLGMLIGGRSKEAWSDVRDRRVGLVLTPGSLSVSVPAGR